jgi:hypothetical protein
MGLLGARTRSGQGKLNRKPPVPLRIAAAMNKKGPHFIDAHVESIAPATIEMIRENLVL